MRSVSWLVLHHQQEFDSLRPLMRRFYDCSLRIHTCLRSLNYSDRWISMSRFAIGLCQLWFDSNKIRRRRSEFLLLVWFDWFRRQLANLMPGSVDCCQLHRVMLTFQANSSCKAVCPSDSESMYMNSRCHLSIQLSLNLQDSTYLISLSVL